MKSPAFSCKGHWSLAEKQLFIQGYRQFGRQWSKYPSLIPSRAPRQVSSHAQKCLRKGIALLEAEVAKEEACYCEVPQLPCFTEAGVQCDEVDVLLDGNLGLCAEGTASSESLPSEDSQVSNYEGFWECPQTYI